MEIGCGHSGGGGEGGTWGGCRVGGEEGDAGSRVRGIGGVRARASR